MKFLVASCFLFLLGCGDVCRKLECENGGTCHDGICLCEKWYSGDDCSLFFNRNYEGRYEADSPQRSHVNYLELVADDAVPNRLLITDGPYIEFYDDSTLTVPVQSFVFASDTVVITGDGRYYGEVIYVRYGEFVSGLSSDSMSLLFEFSGRRTVVE